MASTQDKRILNEMKSEMSRLYRNLGNFVRKRDLANCRTYERKICEMEKLFEERFCHVYDCQCGSDEDSDEEYNRYLHGKPGKCISCLRDFVEREKREYPPLLDKLNWGLSGPVEAPSSEDSSGVTSSDEDTPKTRPYAIEKTLRKLRREGPDKFQLKYFSTGVEESLKKDICRNNMKEKLTKESVKTLMETLDRYNGADTPQPSSFDDFAGGFYKFSSDIKLKSKYSNTRFNFITAVVTELQDHLRRHSKEHYPNVSEVMAASKTDFYQSQEALSCYYEVLNKRNMKDEIQKKKCEDHVGDKTMTYSKAYAETYPTDTLYLPAEEVHEARKTGVLNLVGRALDKVPALVWLLDRAPLERKATKKSKYSTVPLNLKETCTPLTCLDLSNNLLTDITPEGTSITSLVTLKLAGNKIVKLPSIFKKFTCLTNVDVANNVLTKLSKAFGRIYTLKTLNASNNCIERVPDELGNLIHLSILDLRWNKLQILPESLSKLCNLKVLNVGYNRLRKIPARTNNMTELIVLDVSYNKLSMLPPMIDLANMIVFNASGNYIKKFPRLTGCNRLCEVRLDGNRIKRLAIDLLKDVPIVQLTLSYNKILKIPDDFFRLETLVLLDLTGNRLTWLPWSLARLKYLSCIKVEMNSIQNVRTEDIKEGSKRVMEILLRNLLHYEGDEEVVARVKREEGIPFKLESKDSNTDVSSKEHDISDEASYSNINLFGKTAIPVNWMETFAESQVSSLDLSKNSLGWLPHQVTKLASCLKQLFVRDNCFRSIPSFVNELTHLTVFDVSGNHLSTFPDTIRRCPLRTVICKYNQFSSIPNVLFHIRTITELDFSFNEIKVVDVQGLKKLKDLTTLNLHANEIKHVPSGLGFLTNIKELDIGDNMFKCPEENVLEKGTEEVLAYLRKHDESGLLYKYSGKGCEPKHGKKHVTISKLPAEF